jgi:hypothetical protein
MQLQKHKVFNIERADGIPVIDCDVCGYNNATTSWFLHWGVGAKTAPF